MVERNFDRCVIAALYDDIIEDLIDFCMKYDFRDQLLWDLLDEKLIRNEC